jgi:pyridoxamine 5'-phosphate oxidase-like protein
MISWGDFAKGEPELAAFGKGRLEQPVAYLATVRSDGRPRVHPFTPILTETGLYLFMEPTSPKGRDLRERGWYALHTMVTDMNGTGGEFWLSGKGIPVEDPSIRVDAGRAAKYDPAERYVLFELLVDEARCNGYGDVPLPDRRRWSASTTT